MCKLGLKDAYFIVPLDWNLRKFVRFQWKGTLYVFMCLCFGLGPAPRVFTKLLKIPISLLRKINIRVMIYLDDMLILSNTIREAYISWDTFIYLLKNLDLTINIKNSILYPCQQIEFLGMEIDSYMENGDRIMEIQSKWLCHWHQRRYIKLSRLVRIFSGVILQIFPNWTLHPLYKQ